MLPAGFEPAIPASEKPQTRLRPCGRWDRPFTVVNLKKIYHWIFIVRRISGYAPLTDAGRHF